MLRAATIVLALGLALPTQTTTEQVFVDREFCPFECCQYGDWTTRSAVALYAEPSDDAEVVGRLDAGQRVLAVSGEVHTVPGRFVVHRAHGRYRPGDVLRVYTYVGEGFFRVEFDGEISLEELGFGPHGVIPDSRCSDHPSCFGELDEELVYTWWVRVELDDGLRAWTRDASEFDGTDGCA